MLGRVPRLPHGVLRWLIVALLLLNGVQLVLLQVAINSSALGDLVTTWTVVIVSGVALLAALALIAYGFARARPRRP